MFDGSDKETFYSLNELYAIVQEATKPIVLWVGAGASRWCGYPSWSDLATVMHSEFLKSEPAYDREYAQAQLASDAYPDFFQLCFDTNSKRYYSIISTVLGTKNSTPVYERFISLIKNLQTPYIVTTNVDEHLEHNLAEVSTIQRSNLEKAVQFLREEKSFVAKLHGSISAIESTVFTSNDYDALVNDESYLNLLSQFFSQATVIFLGYGLRDQYVITRLQASERVHSLFGDGPHFVVTSNESLTLPESMRVIRYKVGLHDDHRSAMQVLQVIRPPQKTLARSQAASGDTLSAESQKLESAYFIADLFPPGELVTSLEVGAASPEGRSIQFLVGQGFDNSEVPTRIASPWHDVLVGLICFDRIYLPLDALGLIHSMLGSGLFWHLVHESVLKFIHWDSQPVIIYGGPDIAYGGEIAGIKRFDSNLNPITTESVIKSHLSPLPGKEVLAEQQFKELESMTTLFNPPEESNIPDMARGLLLQPEVRKLIGLSNSIAPSNIPRWNAFPVIRLCHVLNAGVACDGLKIAAMKLTFGGEQLAGPIFSTTAAKNWAGEQANYVLAGKFNSDLGELVFKQKGVIDAVLKLRESNAGTKLREEILDKINLNRGSEIVSSFDAGLKESIPTRILERARNQLSGFLAESGSLVPGLPVLYSNLSYDDDVLGLWRTRSNSIFSGYLKDHSLGQSDYCPCDSGELVKDCCQISLGAE